jgi:hypothetical protein
VPLLSTLPPDHMADDRGDRYDDDDDDDGKLDDR